MSVDPRQRRSRIAGWGGVSVQGIERLSTNLSEITDGAALSRGLGRSYGDSSLPADPSLPVAGTRLADRFLGFDSETGLLRAEAGLSLLDINRVLLPRGWFVAVTPGTQFVTLGGMVAADVHGKNHHVDGCIGEHVTGLRMRLASGRIIDCGPDQERDLFRATVGGMGLTGHILEVEMRLRRVPSPWIWSESRRIGSLAELLEALREASEQWPFTVAWSDVLARGRHRGRGILMCGRWADPDEAPTSFPSPKRTVRMPVTAPSWVLSRPVLRLLGRLYYWRHLRRARSGIVHPESFFYPLDVIADWNRAYGRRGFTQYQCVIPDATTPAAAIELIERLVDLGGASLVTVIKDCGVEGTGLLSLPRPGVSIAIDVPIRRKAPHLVSELNRFVLDCGGRIYLAKDMFSTSEQYRAMEPRLPAWNEIRRRWDPDGRLHSAQSARLLDEEVV